MGNLILASLILIAAGDVEVRTVDGARVEGRLTALDDGRMTVETPSGTRSLAVRELMSIGSSAPAPPAAARLPVVIRLVDGSTFHAERFEVAGARAETTPSPGPERIPIERIRSVRLADAEGPVLDQWNRLLGESFSSDVLVVVRGEAINYHRGVLGDVSESHVVFEPDGEVLQVKRSKVFGLIYYHSSGRVLPGVIAILTDANGSRWAVHTMLLSSDVLRVTTPSGVTVECSLASLRRLDFSQGKILSLGQLAPRSVRWTPYLGLGEEIASRRAFFAPVRDPGTDGPPLVLGGVRYTRGVALRSRTELDYDLPEGYRRLQAIVGIDDAFRPRGNARLVIRADGRTLVETTLTGTQPPRAIDLDVAGAGRLTILVDFGEGMDLGDHVDLCEARLVK